MGEKFSSGTINLTQTIKLSFCDDPGYSEWKTLEKPLTSCCRKTANEHEHLRKKMLQISRDAGCGHFTKKLIMNFNEDWFKESSELSKLEFKTCLTI